jgi:protocatechuate 3,4-dioxygenase beta subunit
MQRSEFLKRLGLGTIIAPLAIACNDDSSNTGAADECTVTPTETEGPFPTKSPADRVVMDIRAGRSGVQMTVNITIQNKNTDCKALQGAIVDIWHCDADGNYSEYGGNGMQSTNYQSVHFLRGRQTTNSSGVVSFTTIFPGWYSGRAPHIHVHIYDSKGNSLLVTQIAFPVDICDTVYTAATAFYKKGKQDTSNANDNVFSDSLSNNELATVRGNITDGYVLMHTIVVNA